MFRCCALDMQELAQGSTSPDERARFRSPDVTCRCCVDSRRTLCLRKIFREQLLREVRDTRRRLRGCLHKHGHLPHGPSRSRAKTTRAGRSGDQPHLMAPRQVAIFCPHLANALIRSVLYVVPVSYCVRYRSLSSLPFHLRSVSDISVELTEVYEFPGAIAHLDCTIWPGRLPAPWVSSKEQGMTVAKIIEVALLSVEEVWST